MNIEVFFDEETSTLSYIVWNTETKDAVVIDSVLNYDQASSTYHFKSIEQVSKFLESKKLKLYYIMETHAHADHLSGSAHLKKRYPGAKVLIGGEITKVQETFGKLFNLNDFESNGHQFDRLVVDGEVIEAGALKFTALHTPGHTEACYSFLIEDALFVGDALFMPDFGVGRCDFPQGSAEALYDSITKKIYTLPDETRIYTCHDYQPGGRELRYESTVGEQKRQNVQLTQSQSKADFVKFRTERDRTLSAPRLLLPSLFINIQAGRVPVAESNGVSYMKLPIQKKT